MPFSDANGKHSKFQQSTFREASRFKIQKGQQNRPGGRRGLFCHKHYGGQASVVEAECESDAARDDDCDSALFEPGPAPGFGLEIDRAVASVPRRREARTESGRGSAGTDEGGAGSEAA